MAAYALALALAVQFNFVVSQLLVWPDRPVRLTAGDLFRRWLSFHLMIALSLIINFVTFAIAVAFGVSDLAATLIAVAASTAIKFLSLDRYTFSKTNRLFRPN